MMINSPQIKSPTTAMNNHVITTTVPSSTTSHHNNNNNRINNGQPAPAPPIHDIPLYNMPDVERNQLCFILDERNVWQDLAINMGYDKTIFKKINSTLKHDSNKSPSDELITEWESQNHTVTELFVLLSRMQQYTAMDAIKNLVDSRYHRLISTSWEQPDLCALLSNASILKSTTDKHNLNNDGVQKKLHLCKSEKILNGPIEVISRENNESIMQSKQQQKLNLSNFGSLDIHNVNEYASTIPQIEYQELLDATNNWNEQNILGKGGFGTVYKGKWKFTAVAIKRIEYHGTTGTAEINKVQMQQSLNELRHLNSCRHDNILPLYGYSINGKEPCLVYQLMSGGSLEQRLCRNPPLTWNERLDIAWGTARGLQFLHTFKAKPLIHGDIKPANILLDTCKMPKIGDFGLAREGHLNSAMEVSRVYGTRPYLPAEFLGYRTLSTKVDTYSFGVVLFEMATGLKSYDKNRTHKFLTRHVNLSLKHKEATLYELMCQKAMQQPSPEEIQCYEKMLLLGCDCTNENPDNRPEMVEVLRRLDRTHII